MRRIILLNVLLYMAILPRAARAVAVAASYHCAGTGVLRSNTNLTTLNEVLATPNSSAFCRFALERVSGLLSQSWRLGSNATSLISPLLGDLLKDESCLAFGLQDSKTADFVLAVHLDDQRAQVWQDILARALGGPGKEFTSEQSTGRRWVNGTSGSFWAIHARDWLLFGGGENLASVRTQYLQEITQHGRPVAALTTNWLESDLDLAALAPFLSDWAKALKPGKIHLTVAPRTDKLEVAAKIVYPSAVPWNSEPWKLPKQLVQNPLISFTSGRDVAAFLQVSSQFSNFDGNPLTNQFFAWALSQMPLQTYMAWPVSDTSNAMTKLSIELPPVVNPILHAYNGTQIVSQPDHQRMVLANLRVVAPFLEPARNDGDFLVLSLFPRASNGQPVPGQLWSEINHHSNLVYYDWEMTGMRLQQWRLLNGMLWSHPRTQTAESMDGRLFKNNLLGNMGNKIGTTVTEITLSAPNELSIVRKGPLGLTGLEIILLVNWLSDSGA